MRVNRVLQLNNLASAAALSSAHFPIKIVRVYPEPLDDGTRFIT